MWQKVYPEFKVKLQTSAGRPVLMMPHFADPQLDQRRDATVIDLIRKSLNRFVAEGLEHKDVKWRNIGLYLTDSNSLAAVVYDMDSVVAMSDDGWVETAMKDLRERALTVVTL